MSVITHELFSAYLYFLACVVEMTESVNCASADLSSPRYQCRSQVPLSVKRPNEGNPVAPATSKERQIEILNSEHTVQAAAPSVVQYNVYPLFVKVAGNSEGGSAQQEPDPAGQDAGHSEHSYSVKQTSETLAHEVFDLQQKLEDCTKKLRRSQQSCRSMSRKVSHK